MCTLVDNLGGRQSRENYYRKSVHFRVKKFQVIFCLLYLK